MDRSKSPTLRIELVWDERSKSWIVQGVWQKHSGGKARVWFIRAATSLAVDEAVAMQLVRIVRAEMESMLPW